MTEEQALKKYNLMLHKIAWNFHNTTGVDVDDLFSEANLAFLHAFRTWDPKKGELGTRIWVMVTNRLKSYLRKQSSKVLPVIDMDDLVFEDPRHEVEAKESFDEILSSLSEEARDLVQIVLYSPGDFMRESARATRGALTRFLRQNDWPVEKIARCYREVKGVLNA